MFYYKIIKDGIVIDVNNAFFRYQKKHRNIVECGSKNAQLIQSSDGKNFYTAEWLMPLPEGVEHEVVEVVTIDQQEFAALKDSLALKETIRVPEASVAAEPELMVAPEEKTETVMSATEMRKRILELETLVQKLLDK